MLIRSKYPGRCKSCGSSVHVGDRVYWTKGVRGVICVACGEPGRRPDTKQDTKQAGKGSGEIHGQSIVDSKAQTWQIDWNELRDLYLAASDGKQIVNRPSNAGHVERVVRMEEHRARWCGYQNDDVKRWIISGYSVPGLVLGDPPVPIREKRRLRFNEEEGEFHYDLAMSGDDNYFSEWTKREIIPGLAIEAEIRFSADVSEQILKNYYSWICRAVYSLEENGVDCQVTLTSSVSHLFDQRSSDPLVRTIIRVKKENEISDFTYWSAMISPASLRTFGILAQTLHADAKGYDASYGQGGDPIPRDSWGVKFDPDRRVLRISVNTSGGGYSFPEELMTKQLHEALAETRKLNS
jgi:hypothetical protein